jgi:IS605 OrfB family transposase
MATERGSLPIAVVRTSTLQSDGKDNRRGCSTDGVQGPKEGSIPISLRNLSYFSAYPLMRRTPHSATMLQKRPTNRVERTVVIGDLSQRQMVLKEHRERNKHLNRAVFNDWLLYTFVQTLVYKCMLYGKELILLDERDTSKICSGCGHKQAMPLWKRTYRCPNEHCRFVMDRDENSAVNILKRFFARLGPHTDDSVRCADVFTAIDDVNTFEHI